MNILITSVGKRVSLVKAFKKELKTMVPHGLVMTADSNTELAAACVVSDKAFLPNFVINDLTEIKELLKLNINV